MGFYSLEGYVRYTRTQCQNCFILFFFSGEHSFHSCNKIVGKMPKYEEVKLTMADDDDKYMPQWNGRHVACAFIGWLCCPFFGTLSIIYTLQAYVDHKTSDYRGYRSKKRCGNVLAVTAIIFGAVFISLMLYLFYNAFLQLYLLQEKQQIQHQGLIQG